MAMTPLSFSQTLSPLPLPLRFPIPIPNLNPNPRPTKTRTLTLANSIQTERERERGIDFDAGDSFRRESSIARDLAALSACIHRTHKALTPTSPQNPNPGPTLRVLDAMCGCGVRSLRYLLQSGADFVHANVNANDAFEGNRPTIVRNLSRVPRAGDGEERRWIVTHNDANRVMVESYLNREYLDVVDVDSFGSDSAFIRSAIRVVRNGGLLYQ